MTKGQYFRLIISRDADPEVARSMHSQRLQNYSTYGEPWLNSELNVTRIPIAYKIEIESQSIATCMFHNFFTLTTQLCCHDEEKEENEQNEYRTT